VADLLEALQENLGSQYRIERELGGGGMSRVFLAEDKALGRRVVIKVLSPELAAVISADRFQREVRLAAALQHPHIVPLLTAGQAGDTLYYTMPFIEGESLRARLSREHELPVAETVRLFREIVDAIAYAHRQGIVHRDIKPDNILLSQHHAVVTDFGIAKALTAAGGAATLTATGVSIGTPAYMAPEQATGDAGVDHRADIYSLGALAYEMLAGEPPFRGATAQALIAAQLTKTATPLTESRPAVPAELAAAIHRCLEKRPADRFQHAEELLAALEGFTAPTPTGVRTSTTPLAPSARGWPLARMLGFFALVGAALLGLAWALRTLAGLPDWFFPAAVILLALGLPVVVLATMAHNRRLALPESVTPSGGGSRLTIRNAVLGGVGAFSALGLVTGGYMAMRLLGIGPVGSLVASGKLGARERLIIADFANQTRDSLLGPAVTQAFRVDFSQSKLVSPVEADYVRRVLQRMQRPDSIPIDLTVAREIAQREGFKAVVAGELQQVGPSILVSAQLVNAESGEVLATARETARDSTGILDAVDRISRKLRARIGESLRSIRANAPLADVTTGSLEALRNYSQAILAEGQGDNPRGIALLEAAVAHDSTFAMAWRKLGTMLFNAGERQARAEEALTRAFALRERLTFRERKLTEDSYYSDSRGMNDSALAAVQSLLAEYPEDSWALNNLGVAYEMTGNEVAAEEAFSRSATLEPENILAWRNIFTSRVYQARFDSAASTLRLMKERFPRNAALEELDILLDLGRRDFAAAETRIREQMPRFRSDPRAELRLARLLAGVLTVRGKLAEADRALIASAELRAVQRQPGQALLEQARRAVPIAMYRGDQSGAAARLEATFRATPIEGLAERDRPLGGLIHAAVQVGDRDRAEALLREFERNPGTVPGRALPYVRAISQGQVLAMRKETLPQALEAYRAALRGPCDYCVDVSMADAFDRAGMHDSALVHYQRWADAGEDFWDGGRYNFWQPVAYFRLGELYQAKGDKARAIDFYGSFTELWKNADPELQPKVREARQRIRELIQEPR